MLIQAFFSGYRSVRPLAAADLDIQPAMLLAQRLWVTSVHLKSKDRLGSFGFGETYLARFTTWLHAWDERFLAASVWT